MTIERLPFEHRPRNSIANNLDKINELVDWANLDTHLWASASGERVTVDDASSLKGLMVDGRSVQDGTPTPDAPVPVQVVEGPLSLVIGNTSVAINLQGNALASLPDGTRDELHIDSAGRVWIDKRVNKYTIVGNENIWNTTNLESVYRFNVTPSNLQAFAGDVAALSDCLPGATGYNTNTEHVYTNASRIWLYISNTYSTAADALAAVANSNVYYKLATPQTINLGYITPPAIPSGSVVTVSASLTPEFTLEWWVDDSITDVIEDLKAYVDYRIGG